MVSTATHNANAKQASNRITRRRRRTLKAPTRRGAAVVEFAVVAPLLFALTLGMMEVSRMVMVKQLMVNASREGARLAVLPGSTKAEVIALVSQELTATSVNGVSVDVNPDPLAAGVGDPITVSLNVEAATVSWVPTPLFSFNQTLNASTTMRKESL